MAKPLTEAEIRKELDDRFRRWEDIQKNGCNDPFWEDGVNMNLVRNHIIYYYGMLKEVMKQPLQMCLFSDVAPVNERPVPPEVPNTYMSPTGKYPNRLVGRSSKK